MVENNNKETLQASNVYSEDGVFLIPAPRRKEKSRERRIDESFKSNEFSMITSSESQSIVSINVKEADVEKQIEHIESFLKVLKARHLFLEAQLKKNESFSNSRVQDVLVDITRNNNDYNKNIHELWNIIEGKQLQANLVNRAIEVYVIKSDVPSNIPSIELRQKRILDLLVQFAGVVENETKLKQNSLQARKEVIIKQGSSIEDIDKLLQAIKPNIEKQQKEFETLKNARKKLKKLKIVRDIFNCLLTEVDEEIVFSDPKLLDILKRNRKPIELRLKH